ncbi:MAG TPA: Spy/CpxP family protein refolding chaperone [Thermoanaerobaculia bacterium]|nr:Spy/CpxP family protein refolding chaperone [Thermoanaerobaculia bacterium]
MHPGFISWWHRRHGCGPAMAYAGWHGYGPRAERAGEPGDEVRASGFDEPGFGGGFGVRRPLRFLAYKLQLDREQTAQLAAILDDLKTERAQAAVDTRRSTAAMADALAGPTFDAAKVAEAGQARVETADRLRKSVARALEKIHALLNDEQRKKLAYYIRAGVVSI